MNVVDARCMECDKPIRWLVGTSRLCKECRANPKSDEKLAVESVERMLHYHK